MLTLTFTRWVQLSALFIGSWVWAGCGADSASLSATPGGAQDEALANEKIEHGRVPSASDITVEGMLASHDLPLEGPACDKELCINSAYAIAPTLTEDGRALFVQMGFTSGIDEASFERLPLNLSVVVDRSGSMAGEKMASVRTALRKLISQLGPADRLSIVLFDDRVDVLLPSTNVTDKPDIESRISRIVERGSTNLALGLTEGIKQVKSALGEPGISNRVMVLTDAQVNTGSTDPNTFVDLASGAAEEDIGLTVFGVGLDLNQDLVLAISKLRGGSYFYLADAERIATVFDRDFDYLVTPLAYDLKFTLTPAPGYAVGAVYGFPNYQTGSMAVQIEVKTLFLSRGHGAIVAQLMPTYAWSSAEAPLAKLELSYTPAQASTAESEVNELVYDGREPLGGDTLFYSQVGVRRTVAYVNAALGMKQACASYWDGDSPSAIELLTKTESLLTDEAAATLDDNLDVEASRAADLCRNMQEDGPAYDAAYSDGEDSMMGPMACALRPAPRACNVWLGLFGASAVLARRLRARRSPKSRDPKGAWNCD